MEKFHADFDIVKNLAIIEKLKCQLLSGTASLFHGMTTPSATNEDRKNDISEIIIAAYLLSDKLGIGFAEIDRVLMNKLKAGMLKESSFGESVLYKYMNKEH